MGKRWFYHGFTAKFPVDQAWTATFRSGTKPILPRPRCRTTRCTTHHTRCPALRCPMRFTAALRCPGTSEDLRKTVAPVMGGGPTTVVKPIFTADLKVDISIQPLLFMEDIIYGRFRGDLWDLNRTWIDVEACWIILFLWGSPMPSTTTQLWGLLIYSSHYIGDFGDGLWHRVSQNTKFLAC